MNKLKILLSLHLHYRSKVGGHSENLFFLKKSAVFINDDSFQLIRNTV